MRRTALGGLLLFPLLALFLVTAQSAWARTDLSVSYPAAPILVKPGVQTTFTIEVGNVGHTPLTVTVGAHQVILLQSGQTKFAVGPDPLFAGRTHITPRRFTLEPRQKKRIRISVDIPGGILPEDYFLGFLVSSETSSLAVRTVNAVGALVVLDVPGARKRPKLSAWFVHVPHLALAGSVTGYVRVKNTGLSTVRFTTDTVISGHAASKRHVIREAALLLPPGLTRDVPVYWSPRFGLGWYTIRSTIVYNVTAQRTAEVTLSRTVVVIDPWLALPLGDAILAVLIAVIVIRRLRRKTVMSPD